ncbi:Unknown protein [Striga hermonthica]|uniref:Uncharacterized protein n=1 Tax=Striga hermonthica TaxID=68872 RepID=A0A9N7MMG4_STRHE|nr:Unknown protein [Striga hermonthica]
MKGNVARFDMSERRLDVKGLDEFFGVFASGDERKVRSSRLLEESVRYDLVKDFGDKVLYLSAFLSFGDITRTGATANTIWLPIFYDGNAIFYSLRGGKFIRTTEDTRAKMHFALRD